jgi:hypothetical protein
MPGAVLSIIETWDKANQILSSRSVKMSSDDKTSYQNKYLYSGKIHCMTHNTTYWRNIYKYETIPDKEIWQCKIYRSGGKQACDAPMFYKDELDNIVGNIILDVIKNKEYLMKKVINTVQGILCDTNYNKEINDISQKMETINKRKNKLLDLSINELIDNDEFKRRNEEFNIEIQKLNERKQQFTELNSNQAQSQQQLKQVEKLLYQYSDTEVYTSDLIGNWLNKIEVYPTSVPNIYNLHIILKLETEVLCFYQQSKNRRLLPSIHIESNKRIFKFTRNKNALKQKPYQIEVNTKTMIVI